MNQDCSYKEKKKSGRVIDKPTSDKCPVEGWVPEIGDKFDSGSLNADRATKHGVYYRFKIMTPSFFNADRSKVEGPAMLPVPPDEAKETPNISSIPITCCAFICNDSKTDFNLPHEPATKQKPEESPLDFWLYTTALDEENIVFHRGTIRSYKYKNKWVLKSGETRWTYQIIHLPIFVPDERAFGDDERPMVTGFTKRIYYQFWGLWSYDDFTPFDPSNRDYYDKLL